MKYLINELNDNHPIKIYLKENILIKDFLEKLKNISIHDDFMGPAGLYLKCGFAAYSEIEDRIIMRKYLK